jgi:class 3 adenylate cyclase
LNRTNITTLQGDVIQQYTDISAPDALRMKFLTLEEMTDQRMMSAVTRYGVAFLLSVPTPFASTWGTDVDAVAIDILTVSDEYGLDLRLIFITEMKSFLGSFYYSRNFTLAGTFTAVVALIALGAGLSFLLISPLKALGFFVQLEAHLVTVDDELLAGAMGTKSTITEVLKLQQSYRMMRSQLDLAVKYLPESVVAKKMRSDECDNDGAETPQLHAVGSLLKLDSSGSSTPDSSRRGSSTPSDNEDVFNSSLEKSRMETSASVSSHRFSVTCSRLNFEAGLVRRHVTIMVVNAADWHVAIANMDATKCHKLHRDYVSCITREISNNRGSVDLFQGDHLVASFNGVKENTRHCMSAVATGLKAVHDFSTPLLPAADLRLHVGISSGKVICGNICAGSSRFNLIGAAYKDACFLAGFSRRRCSRKSSVVVAEGVRAACRDDVATSSTFAFEPVDVVPSSLSDRRLLQIAYAALALPTSAKQGSTANSVVAFDSQVPTTSSEESIEESCLRRICDFAAGCTEDTVVGPETLSEMLERCGRRLADVDSAASCGCQSALQIIDGCRGKQGCQELINFCSSRASGDTL